MDDVKWIVVMSVKRYFAPIVGACKGIAAEYRCLNRLERARAQRIDEFPSRPEI
jgi:hypothetical protein